MANYQIGNHRPRTPPRQEDEPDLIELFTPQKNTAKNTAKFPPSTQPIAGPLGHPPKKFPGQIALPPSAPVSSTTADAPTPVPPGPVTPTDLEFFKPALAATFPDSESLPERGLLTLCGAFKRIRGAYDSAEYRATRGACMGWLVVGFPGLEEMTIRDVDVIIQRILYNVQPDHNSIGIHSTEMERVCAKIPAAAKLSHVTLASRPEPLEASSRHSNSAPQFISGTRLGSSRQDMTTQRPRLLPPGYQFW